MKKILVLTISLLCLLSLSACGNGSSSNFPNEDEYASGLIDLGSVNRFAGVIVASGETRVEKDDSKTLASVSVSAGDTVTAGQVLFTYDSQQAQLDYDKAAIELEQLNITLQSYSEQKSALEAEKANAGEGEQLSYTIQIQELDTSIRETSYNISLKQKEVEKLGNALNNLEVKAPASGKVQSVNTEGGTDANGAALPFIVIMQTNAFRVKAYINEEMPETFHSALLLQSAHVFQMIHGPALLPPSILKTLPSPLPVIWAQLMCPHPPSIRSILILRIPKG